MTDQELVALLLEEGRAQLAMVRNAARYDAAPSATVLDNGVGLLHEWNEARTKLRAAVMDRLEQEAA
ncbi:MAG: hypothetical protein Q8807_03045 ['Waltheria sp.' little leaf phytoplasma]|nr:hypothetical protein ['Waltheria sp.' little leaf phytoplasma]